MRALISVSDKTGIQEFAKDLVKLGYEIISTGGTFKTLTESGIQTVSIEDITKSPEMMDGRVKTLHPKIHGGLLALRDNKKHMDACAEHEIELIDLVVVNLYPFQKTIAKPNVSLNEAIENIDIGGPSMLRSAAKNYRSVGVVVNPLKYPELLAEMHQNKGNLTAETRAELAQEAFQHTARYDAVISNYLAKQFATENQNFPKTITPILEKVTDLRYGENPHQNAALYKIANEYGLGDFKQLHGKELSYNNIVDLEAAWAIVKEFDKPAVSIIKHTNPCGAALGNGLLDAYKKALDSDPVSAFGSIIGLNNTLTPEVAEEMSNLFIEAIIAPDFHPQAIEILSKKPSLRLIKINDFNRKQMYQFKHVQGAFLLQGNDNIVLEGKQMQMVTKKEPSEEELRDLSFAFAISKHVKSNAIVISKGRQTIGIGAGQMSRVDAVEIALKKAGEKAIGAVAASDAFFPFKDSVELLAKAGISAIIQPGGSKRDPESIEACNKNGISMTFTGIRHFKH